MNVLRNGEILLFGTVGAGLLPDVDGFTALDVRDALAKLGRRDVVVRINSGGGVAAEGVAIYNAIAEHKGRVKVVVESIAASAGSLIAMAGDEIAMRTGSFMMVHDPAGVTVGTLADHAKQMEALQTVAASMAEIYASRTERPVAEIRAEMAEEIWMTAEQAVAKGYATRVDGARSAEPTAFDFRLYVRAPAEMVAMASARNWTMVARTKPDPWAKHIARINQRIETFGAF